MNDRPIRGKAWNDYEIEGDVATDAQQIVLGLLVSGAAPAWIDDVSLQSVGDAPAASAEPPRPLAGRGPDNLVAFTRLLGFVRHFHPSDQAALADWDQLAVDGIRAVESAKDPAELRCDCKISSDPSRPTARVFPSGVVPPLPDELTVPPRGEDIRIVAWEHLGYGGSRPAEGMFSPYRSQRERAKVEQGKPPGGRPNPAKPYFADLGGGVSCFVPLASTQKRRVHSPRSRHPRSWPCTPGSRSKTATRLAAVALAWNILQHFYPYFDVVESNWPSALREALAAAANDSGEQAFLHTLRLMVAALHDGHGNVYNPSALGTP